MFGNTKGQNTEGLSIPALGPGIYQGYSLKKVELTKTTKADGSTGKSILTFLFEGPQGLHQHTEYDVEPTDEKKESKAKNMSIRVTHIASKFIPKDVADAIAGPTFEVYAQAVVSALNPAVTSSVNDLEIKIIGNVYNGKATAGFPGYAPFIARPSQPNYRPLSMSDRERQANKEYTDHISATPDNDTTPTTSSTSSTGAVVDGDF